MTNAGKDDWYRISWCAGTNATTEIQTGRKFIRDDMETYDVRRNNNEVPITTVASFDELNSEAATDGEIIIFDDHASRNGF